eukprot:314823-Pyramimonas_sp.AAC.1
MGGLAGPVQDSGSAVNLGVDDCAGRPLRAKGRCAQTKDRMRKASERTARLARLRPTVSGHRVKRVFSAGPLPGGVYGMEVTGATDFELLSL